MLVEGGAAHYYQTLVDYIHLNPVRARLIRADKGESVLDYAWSSLAGSYALPPKKRAPWLAAEWGLESFGLEDTVAGRRRMVERLDRRDSSSTSARGRGHSRTAAICDHS